MKSKLACAVVFHALLQNGPMRVRAIFGKICAIIAIPSCSLPCADLPLAIPRQIESNATWFPLREMTSLPNKAVICDGLTSAREWYRYSPSQEQRRGTHFACQAVFYRPAFLNFKQLSDRINKISF